MSVSWPNWRVGFNVLVAGVALCFLALEAGLAVGPWRRLAPVAQGARLVSRGEYALAIRDLAGVVASRPHDAQAQYYLGLAYAGFGQRAASLNHLREAVRLDPTDARFHDALGRAYLSVGDTSHGLHEFEAAVRHGPKTPRYEVDLAGLLMDQGRWGDAAAILRRVERGEPASPGIRLLLAHVLEKAGDRGGMEREDRAVIRLADGTALGELARQDLHAAAHATGP